MQPISRGLSTARPRSATTSSGMTAQQRQQLEERRRLALKEVEDLDKVLASDNSRLFAEDVVALPMSRSPSKRKRATVPESSSRPRAASTSRAINVPMNTMHGRLSVSTAMPLPRSMPVQYLTLSPGDTLSNNDLDDFYIAEKGRLAETSSQLISPASSYQGDQYSSFLTTPSSFQSQTDFFSTPFSACEEPRGSFMSRSSSISGTTRAHDMYRTKSNASYAMSNASYAVSNVGSSHGLFSMDEEPDIGSGLHDGVSMETLEFQPTFDDIALGSGGNPITPFEQDQFEHSSFGAQFLSTDSLMMSRSASDQSSSTDTSTRSRGDKKSAEKSQRHLHNARKKTIAPKIEPAPRSIGRHSTKDKQAIAKMPYRQKEQKRVLCEQCTEVPQGFHGAHELRRHMLRAHSERRQVWICDTPADQGPEDERPVRPLNICKSCQGGKIYNAYYNAAAHIRRAHFRPRQPGQRNHGDQQETRAGKAGGDDLPISWLKQKGWIREIEWMSTEGLPPIPPSNMGESVVYDEDDYLVGVDEPFDHDIGFSDSAYGHMGMGFDDGLLGQDECMADDLLDTEPLGPHFKVESF